MKRLVAFAVALIGASSTYSAQIDRVVVRQQWPWSTDVRIEYQVSGVTSPVKVDCRFFDGTAELSPANAAVTVKGDFYADASGVGAITLDPVAAFGTGKAALGDFRVELSLSDAPDNLDEAIYRIYDLDDGTRTDVTRRDILCGRYGAYETDFARIGEGFSTSVSDVLIWTGVTNDATYATTKLVLRKIPAASAGAWQMGSPESEGGRIAASDAGATADTETQHRVTFTKDYWIGVFEVTQAQYAKVVEGKTGDCLTTTHPSYFTEATSRDTRPVENVGHNLIRGLLGDSAWPSDHAKMSSWCFLSLLRAKLGGSTPVDLPTEAQWEFACRGGTETALYSGMDLKTPTWQGDERLSALGRVKRSGGYVGGETVPTAETAAAEGGTARVGSYLPNAYGLYDMLGNVSEWCLDYFEDYSSDAVTDPAGPERNGENWKRVVRGGNWTSQCRYARCASRGDFEATAASGRNPCPSYGLATSAYGFRLCLTEE